MGAFFLYHKNLNVSVEKAKDSFLAKGFNNHSDFLLGNYHLLLYSKILHSEKTVVQINNDVICCVGTFIYKNLLPNDGLKLFLQDFKNSEISKNDISGTFCIIAFINDTLFVINDDENIYPVYSLINQNCLSSSFIALCEVSRSLTFHKQSITENLITGCSFGFDTYFNEIKRIRWANEHVLPEGISFLQLDKTNSISKKLSKNEIYSLQKQALIEVFQRLSPLANMWGCELGLSSGYDSRLLLAICLQYTNNENIRVGSNYKNPPDNDLEIAREIALCVGKELSEIPVVLTKSMSSVDYEDNLKKAFLFYDGQIRVNHGWTREYRTAEYRKKVLGNCRLGASGHAGELLRNDYNIDAFKFSYDLWIKNHLLGKSGQRRLGNKNEVDALVSYIKNKLKHIVDPQTKYISKALAHKYYNEAWIPSGPAIRTSIENQLTYYVSPFTDFIISKTAYHLVPYLKLGAKFEKKLIRYFNQQLSQIPYEVKNRGFALPLIYTTLTYRLGFDLHYISRNIIKGRNKKLKQQYDQSINQHSIIATIFSNPSLNLIIPLNSYINNCSDESELDRLVAFAYVCYYYRNKIAV